MNKMNEGMGIKLMTSDIVGQELSREEELIFNFNRYASHCIVKRRQALNMTQDELAQKSGVSRVTISGIEKNRRVASTDVLLKLVDALDLGIAFYEK